MLQNAIRRFDFINDRTVIQLHHFDHGKHTRVRLRRWLLKWDETRGGSAYECCYLRVHGSLAASASILWNYSMKNILNSIKCRSSLNHHESICKSNTKWRNFVRIEHWSLRASKISTLFAIRLLLESELLISRPYEFYWLILFTNFLLWGMRGERCRAIFYKMQCLKIKYHQVFLCCCRFGNNRTHILLLSIRSTIKLGVIRPASSIMSGWTRTSLRKRQLGSPWFRLIRIARGHLSLTICECGWYVWYP